MIPSTNFCWYSLVRIFCDSFESSIYPNSNKTAGLFVSRNTAKLFANNLLLELLLKQIDEYKNLVYNYISSESDYHAIFY